MNNGGLLFDEDARVEKIELDGFDGAASVFEKGETSITFTQNINPVKPREDIVELGRKEYFEYPKKIMLHSHGNGRRCMRGMWKKMERTWSIWIHSIMYII